MTWYDFVSYENKLLYTGGNFTVETIFIQHSMVKSQLMNSEPCVLALGFFDGVHLGHQGLIQTAKRIAAEKNVPMAVMTFYPHPRQIVNKSNAPVKYITPLYRKQDVLNSMGVDRLYIVKFDPDFAKLSPEEFVEQYLINLGCLHIVAGFDYTYGYKGQGNMETLIKAGEGHFGVTVIKKISHNKEKISSTLIRQLLQQGHMQLIPKYLGCYHKVNGLIKRSLLLNDGAQELVIRVDSDYLLPSEGQYQIQLTCHNLFYNGIIEKIVIMDHFSLLYVYIYEDYNLSIGSPVNIKWMELVSNTNKGQQIEKENVYVL